MKVNISLDDYAYSSKPDSKKEIMQISCRIASNPTCMEVKEIAQLVGEKGYTFCPAIFCGGNRRIDSFEKMQIFALDFDDGISFEQVRMRAEEYHIPIAFAYHTFSSSKNSERFRVVFILMALAS